MEDTQVFLKRWIYPSLFCFDEFARSVVLLFINSTGGDMNRSRRVLITVAMLAGSFGVVGAMFFFPPTAVLLALVSGIIGEVLMSVGFGDHPVLAFVWAYALVSLSVFASLMWWLTRSLGER
jgi:hypothetical protein